MVVVVLNPLPLTVTELPELTMAGVNEDIVVFAEELVTVNELALVADPTGEVTTIEPVVAPEGTVTTNAVVVAEVMVAVVPLKVTVSRDDVALKFDPVIVTVAPTGAEPGLMDWIVTWLLVERVTDRIFPTAS